jgi:large subunit ribosomal protein L21
MSYAVIKVGGKQYRVREGERLLVDRLKTDPGQTFTPAVLLADGDLDSKAVVTARVVDHVLGDKIRIGKYRAKTGYKKHTGFRASLSQIEIESIGTAKAAPAKKAEAAEEEKPKARAAPKATAAKKPAAEKKPAAKKPAAKKEEKES